VRWIDKVLELALERLPEPLPEVAATPAVAVVAEDAAVVGIVTH
jgi:ATP-dependent Lon protease